MSLITVSGAALQTGAEGLELYFIDVGQGDATLIHQPGKCAILVDGGSAGKEHNVLELLEKQRIATLDYVIVTHPHEDHFGGIRAVADKVEIAQLIDNGKEKLTEAGFADYAMVKSPLSSSIMAAGDSFTCGDVGVTALHPAKDYGTGENTNDYSLALQIRYHEFTLLLMGDVSGDGERAMLRDAKVPKSAIMQLGHHGAIDSTSSELLKKVGPKVAIISVAEPNGIGAPAAVVLDRLQQQRVEVYRTDHAGTIHASVLPDGSYRMRL